MRFCQPVCWSVGLLVQNAQVKECRNANLYDCICVCGGVEEGIEMVCPGDEPALNDIPTPGYMFSDS